MLRGRPRSSSLQDSDSRAGATALLPTTLGAWHTNIVHLMQNQVRVYRRHLQQVDVSVEGRVTLPDTHVPLTT